MNNIKEEIFKIYTEKQKYDNEYNNLMFDFINKANELVDQSEGLYQLENSIKLNKISLKDYILNSEFCELLKENNISNYSIEELEQFMNNYEIKNPSFDMFKYKLAIALYKQLEQIEELESSKFIIEESQLGNIFNDVNLIKETNKENYKNIFNKIVNEIDNKYINTNIIDDTIKNYIIQILNDIFNYYRNENKKILCKS